MDKNEVTEFVNALNEFQKAYERVTNLWTDLSPVSAEAVHSAEGYPFDCSFDEILVAEWVANVREKTQALEVAMEFSYLLLKEIGEHNMRMTIVKNRTDGHNGCASHEYCDANMVMLEAFQKVMKREFDFISENDAALWNHAWNIAHGKEFFNDGYILNLKTE